MQIFKKIPLIMGKVGAIGKDRKNATQGYNFRGIDDMYNALNEHLAEEKVFFTSEVLSTSREERETKSGGTLMYSIITMKFTAYAEDGSSVSSTTVGEAMDSGDKSMNKAMSTAYKYALMQIFCIPTVDDKDTENQTHEPKPKQESKYTQNQTHDPKLTKPSKPNGNTAIAWFNKPELEKCIANGNAYSKEAIEQWANDNGYKLSGPSRTLISKYLEGEVSPHSEDYNSMPPY